LAQNGVTLFTAEIGRDGGGILADGNVSITVAIEAEVSSVAVHGFDQFRAVLAGLIGSDKVDEVDAAAGIPQGPQDGRRMEMFGRCLFADMFRGDFAAAQQAFDAAGCSSAGWKCGDVLEAIRQLEPQVLQFKGTLRIEGPVGTPQQMQAVIPVFTVAFDDGYRVPFSGYDGPINLTNAESAVSATGRRMLAEAASPVTISLQPGALLSCLVGP
jgi:hypothetical protein